MPQSPGEPSSPTQSVDLGGAALAAGAVLAGLALRGKSSLPLAAGLAAAAGFRFLTRARHPLPPPEQPGALPSNGGSMLAGSGSPGHAPVETTDWVDSDTIAYAPPVLSGVHSPDEMPLQPVPPAPLAEFPLLDDEGVPVQEPSYVGDSQPGLGGASEFGLLMGPLIWEPGQEVVSYSDAVGETVWFGLRDVPHHPVEVDTMPEPVLAPAPTIESVAPPEIHPDPPPSSAGPEVSFSPFIEATSPPLEVPAAMAHSHAVPSGDATESVTSILDALRAEGQAEVPATGAPAIASPFSVFAMASAGPPGVAPPAHTSWAPPSPLLPGTAVVAPAPAYSPPPPPTDHTAAPPVHHPGGEPMSFADWMLASQDPSTPPHPSQGDGAAPERPLPTSLPPPRIGGALPRSAGGSAPATVTLRSELSRGGHSSSSKRRSSASSGSTTHRSVSPMAPSDSGKQGIVRSLLVFVIAALLVAVLVGAAIWKYLETGPGSTSSGAVWRLQTDTAEQEVHAEVNPVEFDLSGTETRPTL